jgi:hypothetical protein
VCAVCLYTAHRTLHAACGRNNLRTLKTATAELAAIVDRLLRVKVSRLFEAKLVDIANHEV